MKRFQGFIPFLIAASTLLFQGCLSPNGDFSPWDGGAGGVNLEVPVDMVDAGLQSVALTSGTSFAETDTYFDPSAYDGNPQFYLEAVTSNSSTPSGNGLLHLIDPNNTDVAQLPIPVSAAPALQPLVQWYPTTAGVYHLVLDGPASPATSGNAVAYVARIIVRQNSATHTVLYIPLGATSTGAFATGDIADGSYGGPGNGWLSQGSYNIWKDDLATSYSQVSAVDFDVVQSSQTSGTSVYANLAQADPSTPAPTYISSTAIGTSSGGIAWGTQSIPLSALSEGHDYTVAMDSPSSVVGSVYRAYLRITLDSLSKGDVYYRAMSYSTMGNNVAVGDQAWVDPSFFSNPGLSFVFSGNTVAGTVTPSGTPVATLTEYVGGAWQDIASTAFSGFSSSVDTPGVVWRSQPFNAAPTGSLYAVDTGTIYGNSASLPTLSLGGFVVVSFQQ